MDLSGQTAVVVGGASGLGAATARLLVNRGAKVSIFDKDLDRANEAAEEFGASAYRCDVCDSQSISSAMLASTEKDGTARIVVQCAGVGTAKRMLGREGPVELAHFEQVVAVNLIGTFNVFRLLAGAMVSLAPYADSEKGVLIATASIAAFDGQIGQPAYAASKGGIVSMTLPLARELAEAGIRVNTIAPGVFDTPLVGKLPASKREELATAVPFPKRLGYPSEFAELVAHIVENRYLNGEVIRIDGALRLR